MDIGKEDPKPRETEVTSAATVQYDKGDALCKKTQFHGDSFPSV